MLSHKWLRVQISLVPLPHFPLSSAAPNLQPPLSPRALGELVYVLTDLGVSSSWISPELQRCQLIDGVISLRTGEKAEDVLHHSVDVRAKFLTITKDLVADSSMLHLISDRN